MSVTQWGYRLTCDYPACESVGEARNLDEPPAGWLSLRGARALELRDPFGRNLADFCSMHARVPLDKLAEVMRVRKEESGG